MKMAQKADKTSTGIIKISNRNMRLNDPFIDRRSGEDRRRTYDIDFFSNGGREKRSGKERRQQGERRKYWARVSKWSSVEIDKKHTNYQGA